MINNKTLRKQFKQERAEMARNEKIGGIVLTVISFITGIVILAGIVRVSCLAIVWASHLINH